jgi:hypothetical protein
MPTVKAEYDGRVFVPCEEVQLPRGTKVEILVPGPNQELTTEEVQEWHQILQELSSSEPHFPTVEEALQPRSETVP